MFIVKMNEAICFSLKKIVSPQIMKYLAPSLKSKNYHITITHVLPPPKIVIVIVIVDSGIVGAVKHQIGRHSGFFL